jgi:hypothetical protein
VVQICWAELFVTDSARVGWLVKNPISLAVPRRTRGQTGSTPFCPRLEIGKLLVGPGITLHFVDLAREESRVYFSR